MTFPSTRTIVLSAVLITAALGGTAYALMPHASTPTQAAHTVTVTDDAEVADPAPVTTPEPVAVETPAPETEPTPVNAPAAPQPATPITLDLTQPVAPNAAVVPHQNLMYAAGINPEQWPFVYQAIARQSGWHADANISPRQYGLCQKWQPEMLSIAPGTDAVSQLKLCDAYATAKWCTWQSAYFNLLR